MQLLGVDVGGTFTDLVLTDPESGEVHVHKVTTSGEDPPKGDVGVVISASWVAMRESRYIFHVHDRHERHFGDRGGVGLVPTEASGIFTSRAQPAELLILHDLPWQTGFGKRRHRRSFGSVGAARGRSATSSEEEVLG